MNTTSFDVKVLAETAAKVREQVNGLTDPARWVEDYGDYLFGFAFSRLRNAALAEDAVQDTYLAALKGGESFVGRSSEKSWLTGILKHKISDHFRKSGRQVNFTDLQPSLEDGDDVLVDALAQKADLTDYILWTQMGHRLDNRRFWDVYQEEVAKLPLKMAKAFHLREVEGAETMEICFRLGISESNLWVMVHRAKTALRAAFSDSEFSHVA